MKVYATITVELEVDGLGQVETAKEFVASLVGDMRWNFPTPPAGVTFEDIHAPIVEWE